MKRVLRVILFSLISLLLLTSMLITAMFGSVKAEYLKSFSTSLDFEVTQDLSLRCKIKDENNTAGKIYSYSDSKNISQVIKLGTTVTAANAIYEIEFPLNETGLHAVDFTVEFSKSGTTGDFFVAKTALASGYVKSLNNPVGCKFYSRSDFTSTYTRLIYDNEGAQNSTGEIHARQPYNQTRTYTVNNNFQWKTLAPSRAEDVTLSVNATTKKVYLCWDLRGLAAGTYTLNLRNIKVTKINTPDGPYMDFANIYYTNNALFPTAAAAHSSGGSYVAKTGNPQRVTVQTSHAVSGKNEAGKTRQSMARGTYVTEATYDSMTMQAEKLAFGYENGNIIDRDYVESGGFENWDAYSNLISFGIPIKNVKLETTYKLSFDLSIARQGGDSTYFESGTGTDVENLTNEGNATYAAHNKIFADNTSMFQCYLYRGGRNKYTASDNLVSAARTQSVTYNVLGAVDKEYGRGQVVLNDKGLYRTATEPSVQSDNFKGQSLFDLNAAHRASETNAALYWNRSKVTEYNGENIIYWQKYSNLTTSFNIDSGWTNESELKNLALVWVIDAFEPKSWYRIKMENVRIEEVVKYGSAVTELQFNGTKSAFNNDNFKGSNGTGQNYTSVNSNSSIAVAAYNMYGPEFVYASNVGVNTFSTSPTRTITVKGTAACYDSGKKGIAKYVWSADGGETWYDVASATMSAATDAQLRLLEDKAENSMANGTPKVSKLGTSQPAWKTNKKCEWANFSGCGTNSVFTITADIRGTPYEFKNRINIIFAAVPASNTNLRCEILIVKNYNDLDHYVSQIDSVSSDIKATATPTNLQITRDLNNNDNYTDDNVFKRSFTPFVGVRQNSATYSVDDLGVYFYRVGNTLFDNYDRLHVMCSDIPIKTTLTLKGVAVIHGGVSEYAYSVDGGNTWKSISHSNMVDLAYSSGSNTYDHEKLVYKWLTTSGNNYQSAYMLGKAESDGDFKSSPLAIDLSDYVGEVIDVIVAAKGRRGRYCPVARIDNVAVYGDPSKAPGTKGAGPGPFYTRHYSVKVGTTSITPTTNALDGTSLNYTTVWNIGYDKSAYASYEPYNVNYMNARSFTAANNAIAAGGTVTIDGYINCYSGVKEYRYTLDGGKEWRVINQTVPSHNTNSFIGGKFVDVTFTIANDGANSNFCTYTGYNGTPITVTLPSGVTGNKDLLVVAESNAGYIYPILNIPLSIT